MTVHTITNHHIFPLLVVYFSVKYMFFSDISTQRIMGILRQSLSYSTQLNKHISTEREIAVYKNVLKEN